MRARGLGALRHLCQRGQRVLGLLQLDQRQRLLQAGFRGGFGVQLALQQGVPVRQRALGVAGAHARQGGGLQGLAGRLVLGILVGRAAEPRRGVVQPAGHAGHFAQPQQGRRGLRRFRKILHQRFVAAARGVQPAQFPLALRPHPEHVRGLLRLRLRRRDDERLLVVAALEAGHHDFVGRAVGEPAAGVVAGDGFVFRQRFAVAVHFPQAVGLQVDAGGRGFRVRGVLFQLFGERQRLGRAIEVVQAPGGGQPRVARAALVRKFHQQLLQQVGGRRVAFLAVGPVAPAEERFRLGGRRGGGGQRQLEPAFHRVVVALVLGAQRGQIQRRVGGVRRVLVLRQHPLVGGRGAFFVARAQPAVAQIVGRRGGDVRRGRAGQQAVEDRGGLVRPLGGDGQLRAAQFRARRLVALRVLRHELLVETLRAGRVAHLPIAFPGAVQRRRRVFAVRMVPQQREIFRHGRLVEAAQVDAVREPHLLVGREGRGRGRAPQEPQRNENRALHQEPGASVANEMFQTSACRQVSSTRTTCS